MVLPQADGVWEPPVRNTANKVDLLLCPLRPECDLMICAGLCSRQRSNPPIYFVYSVTAAEDSAAPGGRRNADGSSAERFLKLPPELKQRLKSEYKIRLNTFGAGQLRYTVVAYYVNAALLNLVHTHMFYLWCWCSIFCSAFSTQL